jgi:hypothetical protein
MELNESTTVKATIYCVAMCSGKEFCKDLDLDDLDTIGGWCLVGVETCGTVLTKAEKKEFEHLLVIGASLYSED